MAPAGRPQSLLARDVRGGGRVACVVARTGGRQGVECAFDGRADDEMDVQRPSMASAVGSGGGGEKGDDEEYDQSRRRASAHEAPALGDLGDELARNIAGSLFVAECSELLG